MDRAAVLKKAFLFLLAISALALGIGGWMYFSAGPGVPLVSKLKDFVLNLGNDVFDTELKKPDEYTPVCEIKDGEIPAGFSLYDVQFDADLKGCKKIYRKVANVNASGSYIIKINDEPVQRYDNVGAYSLNMSPDGKRVAFTVEENGKKYMVLDGVKGEGYDAIWAGQFSPDSKHFVYGAWTATATGGRHCVVVYDGKKYGDDKNYSAVENFTFLMDGKSFSYAGKWGYTGYEVNTIGTKSDQKIEAMYNYSPDGKHLAFIVREPDGQYIDLDGSKGKKYWSIEPNSIVFSADSQHMAYVVKIDKGAGTSAYQIVSDGAEGSVFPEYRNPIIWYNPINNITYSGDGKHTAYVVRSYGGEGCKRNYSVVLDEVVVRDSKGAEGTDCVIKNCNSCEFAADIAFSEDSKYFAFVSSDKTSYGVISLDSDNRRVLMSSLDVGQVTGKNEKGWIRNIAVDSAAKAVLFDIITASGRTYAAKEYFG